MNEQAVRTPPAMAIRENQAPLGQYLPAAITIAISRETGARGGSIGKRISKKLGWSYYDQELLNYLSQGDRLEDEIVAGLSPDAREWVGEHLAQLKQENRLSRDAREKDIAQLILAIAAKGKAVIVGRGAGALLPAHCVLHVRILAPLEDRAAWIRQIHRLTKEQAYDFITRQDKQRAGMLDAHFKKSSKDTDVYDLMLNSSRLGELGSANVILEAARQKQNQGQFSGPSW
ncbi:MAG: cytidylate kinase-like family protein [Gemmatales bacterium]